MTTIFDPIKLGDLELSNRIIMAPLTRCRADAGRVPNALMAEYYSQRASAGLLIAEATMAMAGPSACWQEPGIHSAAPVAGWRLVTDAVSRADAVAQRPMAEQPLVFRDRASSLRLTEPEPSR
eukprot:gene19880-biopygen6448